MDLAGKNIEQYFIDLEEKGDFSCFPHGENYPAKYKTISNDLYKWVHAEVDAGAMASESKENTGIFLTHHGVNHIKTLIAKASNLIQGQYIELDSYELYLLLMSLHFHDVANILGRKGHAFNSIIFIQKMGDGIVGQDRLTWEYVYEIANAHKGFVLEELPTEEHCHDIRFRPQLLASILKFADELSENFSRSSKINLDLGIVHEESILHHKFSSVVNSIFVKHETREVLMTFNLLEEDLKLKFKKGDQEVFLIDEIYLRTLKTYSEKVYCGRYMRPLINIDFIRVTIKIKLEDGSKPVIGYELKETFVEETLEGLIKMTPDLKENSGQKWYDKLTKD